MENNRKFSGSKSRQNLKYRSQSEDKKGCCNCGSKHPPKRCPAYGKECFHCKKNHFSNMCQNCQHSQSGHRPQSQNNRFSQKDQHEMEVYDPYDNSKWYSYEQGSVCIQFTTKHLYCTKQTNVVFDEIDNENMSRVLADCQVAKCNGPKIHCMCMMFVLNISR